MIACIARSMLQMLPANATAEQLVNAAEAHLILCPEHGHSVLDEVPPIRACRVCGCTDDRACPGGCFWVGPALCSRCQS